MSTNKMTKCVHSLLSLVFCVCMYVYIMYFYLFDCLFIYLFEKNIYLVISL